MYPFDEKTYQMCGLFLMKELGKMLARDRARNPGKPGPVVRLARVAKRGGIRVLLGVADALIWTGNHLKDACYQPSHRLAD